MTKSTPETTTNPVTKFVGNLLGAILTGTIEDQTKAPSLDPNPLATELEHWTIVD